MKDSWLEHTTIADPLAAKEAFLKAVGAGLRQCVWFSQIQVTSKASGEPLIMLSGEAQRILQSLGSIRLYVSISNTSGFAVAVVVLDKDREP